MTARALRSGCGRRGKCSGGAELKASAGVQLHTQTVGLGGRMTEAVVADGPQASGQNMPQIASCKLRAWQGGSFQAVGAVAIFPAEGDGLVGDLEDAPIADDAAGDVGAQIFESGGSIARRLNVHAPVGAPDVWVDLPVVVFKKIAQVLTKGGLEMGQVDEEIRLLDAHESPALIESGAGNQTMDVGMKAHLLVPGVKDGGKTIDGGAQAFVGGQLFRERASHSGEEQLIGQFGQGPEEAVSQLGRQGEGDQEIGSQDELGQFPLDPAGGSGAAALGAGLVIAGMPGEVDLVTASKGPPAQGRGAAMSDSPKGALLFSRKRRSRFEEVGQKLTQRPQYGGSHAATR